MVTSITAKITFSRGTVTSITTNWFSSRVTGPSINIYSCPYLQPDEQSEKPKKEIQSLCAAWVPASSQGMARRWTCFKSQMRFISVLTGVQWCIFYTYLIGGRGRDAALVKFKIFKKLCICDGFNIFALIVSVMIMKKVNINMAYM